MIWLWLLNIGNARMLCYVQGWELDLFEWNEGSCFELLVRRWKDWEENAIESSDEEMKEGRVDTRHFSSEVAWCAHSREVLSVHSRSPASQPPSLSLTPPATLHSFARLLYPEKRDGMTWIRSNRYSSPNKEIRWFETLLQFSARVIKNRYLPVLHWIHTMQ